MSLGLRLTLLNGLVVLLTLAVFATVAYATQYRSLQETLDTSLRNEARRFSQPAAEFLERRPARPRTLIFANPRAFASPDVFIQITASDGESVARSRNLDEGDLPADPGAMQRALQGQEWFTDVEVEGQPLRLFIAPLRIGPGQEISVGMIEVARPLGPTLNNLRVLQTTFVTVGGLGVLVSLVVGWVLARAALRPIDRLAAAAHGIGAARDFTSRVPVPRAGRRDEVGRLAGEFNDMLAQLQTAYEHLEAALTAQRRFVADASHELRTPLTTLRGNVELLRRMPETAGRDQEDLEQILADMAAETDRVTRLVGDLLLLARADAGQHLALVPIEVGALLGEAFRSARFLREGVELRLGDLPSGVWVSAEPDRLRQLCLILLDNALKYTPLGGQVTIEAGRSARGDAQGVVIGVRDTGPGIPEVDRERIFERFYRIESARGPGGAGLGLAIARWIVQEHHGTIEVDSAPARGTTFTVWLPTVSEPVDGQTTREPRKPRNVETRLLESQRD